MDGDRFYYLQRLVNLQFGNEIQNEQFKDLVERTTGVTNMNGNVFAYADKYYDEGRAAKVATADLSDPTKLGNLYAGSKSDGSWHQVFQVDSTGKTGGWLDATTGAFTSSTVIAGAIYDLWGQEVVDLFDAAGHKVFDRANMTWTAGYDPTASAANADKPLFYDKNTDMTTGLSPGGTGSYMISLGADQHKYGQVVDAHATETNHYGTGTSADGVNDRGVVIVDESANAGVGIWSVNGATTQGNGQIAEHHFVLPLNDVLTTPGGVSPLATPTSIGGIDPSVIPSDHMSVDEKFILDVRPNGITVNKDGSLDTGADSAEVLVGTKFNDYIELGIGDDTAYGGAGNDIIFGGKSNAGHNTIYGGDGQDFLFGGPAPDLIDGGKGDDWIWGNSSGSSVNGLDQLIGGDGNDHIFGGIGIDKIFGGTGDDYIYGGTDTDPIVFGGDGNDYMNGNSGVDVMNGDAGDDIMDGGPGVDQLFGGSGDDILRPGPGITSVGGNGGGADVLIGADSQTGPNGQTTDDGFDFADYSQQVGTLGIVGDLVDQALISQLPQDKTPLPAGVPTATNTGDVWFEMEGIIGSKNADVLRGDSPTDVSATAVSHGDNWLIGGSGDDVFQGRGGNDVIVGGSVRLDTLIGTYKDGGANGTQDPYTSYVDGASHRVAADAVLSGGLLAAASGNGVTFNPHLTDLLKSGAYKDYYLGDGGANGGNDTALYTGKLSDYTLVAIDSGGHVLANPHQNWSNVVAIKITDNRTAADFVDANGNPLLDATGQPLVNEGTDLVIGVANFAFADQTVKIEAYFDKAPTLDLHYAPAPTTLASDNFNNLFNPYGNGSGWLTPWQESGDTAGNLVSTTGAIKWGGSFSAGYLQFVQATGAGADGAAISRETDLTGQTSATLKFDLTKNGIGAGETLQLQYSSDGGVSFNTLVTYGDGTSGTIAATGTQTIDLSTQILDSQSTIRFVVNHLNGASDFFRVDNVSISGIRDSDLGINYTTGYTEQLTPAHIASTPLITDPDDTMMASAKVILVDGIAGDLLSVVNALPTGIVATFNGTNEIDLSGKASLAAYQTALADITFSNPTNDNPTAADRHIDVTVNDGLKDSAVAVTTVHFTPVNDAPTAVADNVIMASGTNALTMADWMFLANDFDPDSPTFGISSVTQGSVHATHSTNSLSASISLPGTGSGNFTYTDSDGSATGAPATVTVTHLAPGTATINGTAGNDIIVGDATANTVNAGNGNDVIIATVDNAKDVYDGGAGIDTIDYSAYSAALTFTLNGATAATVGGSGSGASADTVANIENVVGGNAGNTVTILDSLAHVFTAGNGTDIFTGGAGADTMVFASLSQITARPTGTSTTRDAFSNFASGTDKIDLHLVDANTNQNGTQHFTFNDATAFWNGAGNEFTGPGQIRYHDQTVNGVVHTILDLHTTNGAGTADHQIDLGAGVKTIHATDLILS
jgi:Ca2+-binding RTX toxin-like protein